MGGDRETERENIEASSPDFPSSPISGRGSSSCLSRIPWAHAIPSLTLPSLPPSNTFSLDALGLPIYKNLRSPPDYSLASVLILPPNPSNHLLVARSHFFSVLTVWSPSAVSDTTLPITSPWISVMQLPGCLPRLCPSSQCPRIQVSSLYPALTPSAAGLHHQSLMKCVDLDRPGHLPLVCLEQDLFILLCPYTTPLGRFQAPQSRV